MSNKQKTTLHTPPTHNTYNFFFSCCFFISLELCKEWFIYDAVDEKESATFDPKAGKETIDLKEVKRIDHILASLQRKVSSKSDWTELIIALILQR